MPAPKPSSRTASPEEMSPRSIMLDSASGIDADEVTPDKSFVDDLDIDSLSMVEIAVAAQDKFGVEIPDDELKNLKTVQDVIDYVRRAEVSA